MSEPRMTARVLALSFVMVAAGAACFARQDESLEQLMARADAAPAAQQAELCVQVAERELKATIASFKADNPQAGHAALEQLVKYADKAHSAAIHSGKKIKHTEIKLRQIAERLRDLRSNVDAYDQPVVQAAIDKLEDFRTEMLKSMFGPNKND